MEKRWSVGIVLGSMSLGMAARANGATVDLQGVGVLDQLTVPAVPTVDRVEGHATGPQQSTDAIAVPTPTAATSGAALLAGLVAWRAGRRVAGRA